MAVRVATLCLLSAAAFTAGALPAHAQQTLVVVNGSPITSYDVAQRIRLQQLTERKSGTQKTVLEDLINERLKISTAARYGVKAEDADTNRMFTSMASRSGRTAAQLEAALKQSGVDPRGLKQKMGADYVWSQYVRGRYQTATAVRDTDVFMALTAKGSDPNAQKAVEYTLRQIVFVVPRNAPDSERGRRLQEANAFRGRFNDCASGVEAARGLREVIVRDPIVRAAPDVSANLRGILEKTDIGKLTPGEVTLSGVEMVAVCGKREVSGDSVAKREVKEELATRQFEDQSNKLLADARKAALIEYR